MSSKTRPTPPAAGSDFEPAGAGPTVLQPPEVWRGGRGLPWLGIVLGAAAGLFLANPIPFLIERMYGFICYNQPLRLSPLLMHSFSEGKWLVLCLYAIGGALVGGLAGEGSRRLRQHRHHLKTLNQEFELQVAALRHHYKNLTLGIHGFTHRIRRKLANLDAEFHQCVKDGCPTYEKFHLDHEALKRNVVILEEASGRLSQTLSQELEFLKALTSEGLNPELHDFSRILHDSIKDLLELRFRDKKLAVRVNGRAWQDWEDALLFPLEPYTMEVILQNLLTNAMKHGDAIEVQAARDEAGLCVAVQDNGPGLDVEAVKKQLQAYSGPKEPDSSHLGLRVTLHLVEKIGGRLLVASQPGQGCTFFLKLPV